MERVQKIQMSLNNNEAKQNTNLKHLENIDTGKKTKKTIEISQSEKILTHDQIEHVKNRNNQQKSHNVSMTDFSSTRTDSEQDYNVDDMFYLQKENQNLIRNYGKEYYDYAHELDVTSQIPLNFMLKHKIDPYVRTKVVDWIIEVMHACNSDPSTLFLTIHLIDQFHAKCNQSLTNNDIHLTAVVCIYIASKMEDIGVPLRMSHIKKIAHGKFSEKEIKKREREILEAIDFSIIFTSVYDFIKTFIFDFCHNNKDYITQFDMHTHIDVFENICVFLAKMMMHSDEFSPFKCSLKSIACIIFAFDILLSNSQMLSKDAEVLIREWTIFLIDKSQYDPDLISLVYAKLMDYYKKYDLLNYISHSLNKTHCLFFN